MHSIRSKTTVFTIGAILVAILLVFLASFLTIQAETDRHSVENMGLLARNTQKTLDKYLESISQSTEMAAGIAADALDSTVLVENGVVGSSAHTSERTQEQIDALDEYLAQKNVQLQSDFATIASHTYGVITYYYCISPDISTNEHGFFYSKVGKTGYTEQPPLDAREFDPNDLEHYTWYYTPIERGRPSWIGPYTAHFLDEMQVSSYLVPIYKSGTFIGVLGMDISNDTLVEQVRSIRVYNTGFACLLDDQGRVIYHPNLEYEANPDLPLDVDMLKQKDSGNELIRYTSQDQERQLSFVTLSNGMKLVIVAPTSEVMATTFRLTHVIAGITVGVVAVVALLVTVVVRRFTNPLLRLTSASQRLANADYDVELNYTGNDEVGALTNAFVRMRDQIKEDVDDLNRKVRTDHLTGLPNQRYFFQLTEAQKKRLVDEHKSPAMLFVNLVGMKHFNRQYGFQEGDRLICDVSATLARLFGEECVSRFGQDHFAAIADNERVEDLVRELFRSCEQANDGRTLPVSVGIYSYGLGDVEPHIACDRAKYASDQRRGSYESGYRYFSASMLKQVEIVRHVISSLDRALEEQWVRVYYQPIVRAVNCQVCDEEALSRWVDPERGVLSPIDFIPALENASLIYKLDLYVLEQVLQKIVSQRSSGMAIVPHSINLSRSDFDSCDIVEEIRRRVDAAGVARSTISIEITESIIGSDFDFMKRQVERFRALGFPVWMDDFGSGYSSLDVLQSIEFDLLKFDMSFLRTFDEGNNSKVILADLVKMATSLGVDTICEGVETQAQVQFLQEIGCSKLQGYYFGKPMPLESIVERYRTGEQIGYENPSEAAYYASLGRFDLYDPGVAITGGEEDDQNFLGSIPMAVLELRDGTVSVARRNRPYDELTSSWEPNLANAMARCDENGNWIKVYEVLDGGTTVNAHIRYLATNPENGTRAFAIVVF